MSDEIGPEERARRALDELVDRLARAVVAGLAVPAPAPARRPDVSSPVPPVSLPPEGEGR